MLPVLIGPTEEKTESGAQLRSTPRVLIMEMQIMVFVELTVVKTASHTSPLVPVG